tara:strand:+ start:566 stop:820 length:255 start_codon:yes stop_codon:yes gene_type:complete
MSKFILVALVLVSISVVLVFVLPFVASFFFRKLGSFILRRMLTSVFARMEQSGSQNDEEDDVIYGEYRIVDDKKNKEALEEGKK